MGSSDPRDGVLMIGQMRQSIFDDSRLTLFQAAINDQFSELSKIPFINGVTINSVNLITGQTNTINTNLGRKPVGYFITSQSANSVIWNDVFTSDSSMILRCSANVTVNLWVF